MHFSKHFDAIPENEDVGLVYTRDKYGRLRSPPGFGLNSRLDENSDYLNNVHVSLKAANCSFGPQAGLYTPQPLFFICLDFVAKNITMVESLQNFPDIVGKQLFEKVNANKGFDKNCSETLQLFCDSYGDLVLKKLSLSGQYLALNEKVDYFQYFTCLTELDLGHCRLGSSHELLSPISNMSSLMKLSLKNNCLKDADIIQVTSPLRVMGTGLTQLTTLDLSCNPDISDTSVKCLVKFRHLAALNLSGTGISTNGGLAKLITTTYMCLASYVPEFQQENFTTSEGWSVPVIENWIADTKSAAQERARNARCKRGFLSFYSKKAKRDNLRGSSEVNNVLRDTKNKVSHVMMLKVGQESRKHINHKNNENVCGTWNVVQELRKRKRRGQSTKDPKLMKNLCLGSDKELREDRHGLDNELLQSYIDCGNKKGNENKKRCLWEVMENGQL